MIAHDKTVRSNDHLQFKRKKKKHNPPNTISRTDKKKTPAQ